MGYKLEEIEARLARLIHQPLLEDAVFGTVTLASLYSSLGGTKETLEAMQVLGIVPDDANVARLEDQIEGYMRDPESFRGLLNSVKGRVAEIRHVETLNASPEFQENGWHAVFAPTTNYPDIDVFVLDSHGNIVEAHQVKTGSLDYIREEYQKALERGVDAEFYAPKDVADKVGVHSLDFTNQQLEGDVYHDLSGLAAFGDALPVASMGIAGIRSVMENYILLKKGYLTMEQAARNIAIDTFGTGMFRGLCAQGGAALLAGMVGLNSPLLLPLALGGGLLGGFLGGNIMRELTAQFRARPVDNDYSSWLKRQAAREGKELMLCYRDLGKEAARDENLETVKSALAVPVSRAENASTRALLEKRELETQSARGTLAYALADAHYQRVNKELEKMYKWQFANTMKLDNHLKDGDPAALGREIFRQRDLGLVGALRFNYYLETAKQAFADFVAVLNRAHAAEGGKATC